MNRQLVAALAVAVVAVPLGASAHAAPPKGFTKTVTYTDPTPDPTGYNAGSDAEHCRGVLPMEAPITLKVPGPGLVDVSIAGFQGDWSLMVTDADDEVIAGDDVNPPAYETVGFRLKKAATINIHPCNFAGTPEAKVTYKYTYKK